MTASPNSQRLEVVARGIAAASLQSFRRTGCTFRREVEPGFIHIIDIGLGPSWSTYVGQFTVDVCVFISEAYELFFSKASPRRPTATHCDLRRRLGMLASPPRDRWWAVSVATETLVTEVGAEIERSALPFLARIGSRRALVEAWLADGSDPLGLPPRGDLAIAAVLRHLGDRAAARALLTSAVTAAVGRRHAAFYSEVAKKLEAQDDAVPAA